jgi:hypothetical protein
MKKLIVTVCAALLALSACVQVKNDLGRYALNCKVKEIIVESDTLESPYTVTFNDLGQITEVVTRNFDGSFRFHETYTYNDRNELEEIRGVNSEGEDEIRYEYEHDGRFIRECRTYGMNNQEMQRWVHTNNGRHIVKTEFYNEGELFYVTTKDFKGSKYVEKSVNADGEPLGQAEVEFFRTDDKPSRIKGDDLDMTIEYDAKGLPVMSRGAVLTTTGEIMWASDLEERPCRYYSYEYDGHGNWISRSDSYEAGGEAYAVFRRIINY